MFFTWKETPGSFYSHAGPWLYSITREKDMRHRLQIRHAACFTDKTYDCKRLKQAKAIAEKHYRNWYNELPLPTPPSEDEQWLPELPS